jgi:hypothetical protein
MATPVEQCEASIQPSRSLGQLPSKVLPGMPLSLCAASH